jgi:hypothetical protein
MTITTTTKNDLPFEGGLARKTRRRQASFRRTQVDPGGKGNGLRKRQWLDLWSRVGKAC